MVKRPAAMRVVHRTRLGRVRVQCAWFRDRPDAAVAVERALRASPGVREAAVRPLSGSLVLRVDPRLRDSTILKLIGHCQSQARDGATGPVPEVDDPDQPDWYRRAVSEVLAEYEVDPEQGLAAETVAARRAQCGENRLPGGVARSGRYGGQGCRDGVPRRGLKSDREFTASTSRDLPPVKGGHHGKYPEEERQGLPDTGPGGRHPGPTSR